MSKTGKNGNENVTVKFDRNFSKRLRAKGQPKTCRVYVVSRRACFYMLLKLQTEQSLRAQGPAVFRKTATT
jgi:hypothetical protein